MSTSDVAEMELSTELKALLRELQNELGLEGRAETSDATAVAQYCASMQRHSVTRLRQVAALSREDLVELGVAIGHRQWITSVARDLLCDGGPCASPGLISPRLVNRNVSWLNLSGRKSSLAAFLDEMRQIRIRYGFPKSFERLFLHNQPMPFVLHGGSSNNGSSMWSSSSSDTFGILLRIPNPLDTTGTTVSTITTRVCILVSRQKNTIVTYHRCAAELFSGVEDEVRSATRTDGHFVLDCLLESILRRLIRLYQDALEKHQREVDFLEMQFADGRFVHQDMSDTHRVQQLAFLGKRATVHKRCADASRNALLELSAVHWFESHVPLLVSGFDAVSSVAEELSSNTHVSIEVIIALSEFKSSNNLRVFTYLNVFFYPISVATSWYGMNYAMPEIEQPHGYYVFAAVTLSLATLFFCLFVGSSHDGQRWVASWCSTLNCCRWFRQNSLPLPPAGAETAGIAPASAAFRKHSSGDGDGRRFSGNLDFSVQQRLLATTSTTENCGGAGNESAGQNATQQPPSSRWQSQLYDFSDHLNHQQ